MNLAGIEDGAAIIDYEKFVARRDSIPTVVFLR